MRRKISLVNDSHYHIFNRSISKYIIFNNTEDYQRMIQLLDLYRYPDFMYSYSQFDRLDMRLQKIIINNLKQSENTMVNIIAYCLMPTHIHLLLKQITDNGIIKYMQKVTDSYSKFFNVKHKRKGPLWESRFKNVEVTSDEQLLYLTWYLHLNPTSAGLVKKPEQWHYSSYREYIHQNKNEASYNLCQFQDLITLSPAKYKKLVTDRIGDQREISQIKQLLIENYSG